MNRQGDHEVSLWATTQRVCFPADILLCLDVHEWQRKWNDRHTMRGRLIFSMRLWSHWVHVLWWLCAQIHRTCCELKCLYVVVFTRNWIWARKGEYERVCDLSDRKQEYVTRHFSLGCHSSIRNVLSSSLKTLTTWMSRLLTYISFSAWKGSQRKESASSISWGENIIFTQMFVRCRLYMQGKCSIQIFDSKVSSV